jgi:transcriptional regulator with XRE-family HTH domain
MTPEYFWEKINKFRKEENMTLRAVSRYVGLPETYLQNLKNKKNNFPTPTKLMKFKGFFTDDELFEALRSYELLPKEADSFLLELKVSNNVRLKNRLKRKIQRGVSL